MPTAPPTPDPAFTVLVADDDEDDRVLAREALAEANGVVDTRFVVDGQDLLDYLRGTGGYAPEGPAPRPSIILLDLNMPRKDGREALAEIKADAELRQIPVVVLTTSSDETDVRAAYDLGANSYITKPVTATGLERALDCVTEYWARVVTLPDAGG